MNLMKEIDDQSNLEPMRQFLKELQDLEADFKHQSVIDYVFEKIDQLNEIGRGDYQAHMGMAQAAGIPDEQSRNIGAANRRLGLRDKDVSPKPGDRVKLGNEILVVTKFDPKSMKATIMNVEDVKSQSPFAPRNKVNMNELRLLKTVGNKNLWIVG